MFGFWEFEGNLADVVLGCDSLEPYLVNSFFYSLFKQNPFDFSYDFVIP